MFTIQIDGFDRSGKSTLIRKISHFFEKHNSKVKVIHTNSYGLTPANTIEYLSKFLDTLSIIKSEIREEQPDIVIHDRGIMSHISYWFLRRLSAPKLDKKLDKKFIDTLHKIVSFYCGIDYIIVFLPEDPVKFQPFIKTFIDRPKLKDDYMLRFMIDKPFLNQTYDGAIDNFLRSYIYLHSEFSAF